MTQENVIITGLPRSGTTLTCHLLNKLPNAVALHEPMDVAALPRLGSTERILERIEAFFGEMRSSIRDEGRVITKHAEGKVPDNPIGERRTWLGLRKSRAERGWITVSKPLGEDFLLAVKHPTAFTALLEPLTGRFPCYAVVRNPLSVLSSWNSVAFPVQKGHAPMAENLDGHLKSRLAGIGDRIGRQLFLLSWFFDHYERLLPPASVIRYEEMIASGGSSLAVITPAAAALSEPLTSKNRNPAYSREQVMELGARLLASEGAYWNYYPRQSVEAILAAWERG
jgi:hypothetical protein